jgi:protease-4
MSTSPAPRRGVRIAFALSFLLNLALIAVLAIVAFLPSSHQPALTETHYSGEPTAPDKVAVIRISGVLFESALGYPKRQVEQAAKDRAVKAVVLRIDSPGGTITASEDLYQELVRLRDNTHVRYRGTGPKPIVASMGSVAASGGYYVAMPASRVVADSTTITGSIGVFVALPNAAGFAREHGLKIELVKAGAIKGSGTPLQELSPDERQPWQDIVDHAYDRFLTVVATGRPTLTKERLVNEKSERMIPTYNDRGEPILGPDGKPVMHKHVRYRADGGGYTPPRAKELELIDDIADLPAAIKLAAGAAGLTNYRVVLYEREKSLAEQLLGLSIQQPDPPLSADGLASAVTPRLWYLAPGYEAAGTLSATSAK